MAKPELTNEEIHEAYQQLVRHPHGEVIVRDLREGFYDIPTFNLDDPNKDRTLFLEGCRWVVAYILAMVEDRPLEKEADNQHFREGNYL